MEKGFITGGKDGVVVLWDEPCVKAIKRYELANSALGKDVVPFVFDRPPIRAVVLGQVSSSTLKAFFACDCDPDRRTASLLARAMANLCK